MPSTSRSTRVLAVSFTSVASTRGGSEPSVNEAGKGVPSYSTSVKRPTPSACDEASDTVTEPDSVSPSGDVTARSGRVGMPGSESVKPSAEPAPSESVGRESVVVVAGLSTVSPAPAATAAPEADANGVVPRVPETTVNAPWKPLDPVSSSVPGPVFASGPLPLTLPESVSTAAGFVTSSVPPPAARVTLPARVADEPPYTTVPAVAAPPSVSGAVPRFAAATSLSVPSSTVMPPVVVIDARPSTVTVPPVVFTIAVAPLNVCAEVPLPVSRPEVQVCTIAVPLEVMPPCCRSTSPPVRCTPPRSSPSCQITRPPALAVT